ncbi:MAG: hypothetical protein LQ341_000193 [Variospora aurantia]|nr:MAG: hypothetical protein LQ341_000193 [Variospora aurantia]
MKTVYFAILFLSTLVLNVFGFTKDDYEIFRLKDEIAFAEGDSVTFYDFVGVKPSASQDEVIKACRKKSKITHPDKAKQAFIKSKANPPPKTSGQQVKKPGVHVSKPPSEKEIRDAVDEATKRHARLSGVAEILKGEGRERYDYFLANGFPRWRGTGYYYARFRPGLGSVLAGLFVVGGGFAHYGALYVSWKRQKEFVEKYIRHARRAAWGDDSGIGGIPGIDGVTASAPSMLAQGDGAVPLNRRQKRQQERENKKEKDSVKSKEMRQNGSSTPLEADPTVEPRGAKKRVQAENGKTLIVDSAGNVFLEGEGEDGEKHEYLLDPNQIPQPTIRQTLVFRMPLWIWNLVDRRLRGTQMELTPDTSNGATRGDHMVDITKASINGQPRKRGKRSGKVN